MATAAAPRVYKNFIHGEWVEASGGKAYENRNPANTDELVGMFVSSGTEDVDRAVEGDPTADIQVAINNVKWVMKGGRAVVDKTKGAE